MVVTSGNMHTANQKRNTIMNSISKTALTIGLASGIAACGGSTSDNEGNQSAAANDVQELALAANEIENAATALNEVQDAPERPAPPSTQPAKSPAPSAQKPAAQSEPKSPQAEPKPAPKAASAQAEPAPKAPTAPPCTPEHRAMGHC